MNIYNGVIVKKGETMIHKRLKVLILSAAFLGLPAVRAFDWKATGDLVGSDGFAYDAGNVYSEGDRIISTGAIDGEDGGDEASLRSVRTARSKLFRRHGRVMSPIKYKKHRGGKHRAGETETETETGSGGIVSAGGNTEFEATAKDSTLNMYGTLNGDSKAAGDKVALKIDGDIVLKAHQADMTVNVKSDITFVPYIDPTGDASGLGGDFTGTGHAQIQFDVAAGKKIEFNVDHNVEFKGRTLAGSDTAFEPMDMFLSFRGAGEVIFKMADGTAMKFSGDIDDTFKVDMLNRDSETYSIDGASNNAAGTKVLICMDQTKIDVEKGMNKVSFRRKSLANEAQRNMVYVGPNSGFFYVSDDVTGKAHLTDTARGGFGSVAFDVSNQGAGRMVLFLQGARTFGWDVTDAHGNPLYAESDPEYKKAAERFLFNDAAFVVAGHKVEGFSPAKLRTTLNYSIPAGAQAVMRVVDNLAYAGKAAGAPYAPTAADRRGLLLVNDTETVAKLASDNYWDFYNVGDSAGEVGEEGGTVLRSVQSRRRALRRNRAARSEESASVTVLGKDWAYSAGVADQTNLRNTRTGFVLGVNGNVDVYHNTFLDYVAGSVNRVDDMALNDYQDFKHDSKSRGVIAEHNPSAFVVDGLDAKLLDSSLSAFEAANPALTSNVAKAEINLRGNGAVIMRACADAEVGYIAKFWQLAAPGKVGAKALRKAFGKKAMARNFMRRLGFKSVAREVGAEEGGTDTTGGAVNPIDLATLDWDSILSIGEAKFDGYKIEAVEKATAIDGLNVLEVQGPLHVKAHANNSVVDASTGAAREYATVVKNQGYINAASVAIDHTGATVQARPLALNAMYNVYNSPVVYMNDVMTLDGAVFMHNDATKHVDGVPSNSRPAIKGGERMFFSDQLWTFEGMHNSMRYRFPEIRLQNGELALQESLNVAGVRIVATDAHGDLTGGSNSTVRFFDHGSEADSGFTGYGRLLMLGSYHNTMADGKTNWVTESAYINAFKQNDRATAQGATSGVVRLGFNVGDQFPATVADADKENQRSLHLVLSSLMEKGGTNVAAGWATAKADMTGKAFPYNTTRYENKLLAETLSSTDADLFTVDALKVPAAQIAVDKGYVGFGGFDRDGHSAKTPVSTNDAQGVVFVNHGGKISATGNGQAVFDTAVVQRIANDYNFEGNARVQQLTGIVDLPHEQASFTSRGAVQVFGLTKEMLDARAAETEGWVRLAFENTDRPADERSGANEVMINWFNREGHSDVKAEPTKALAAAIGKKEPAKRAVKRSNPLNAPAEPVAKPARLLYVGSGDDVRQMRVAGATTTNPFVIEVSGDDLTRSFGRVREFVTVPSAVDLKTDHRIDEGSHAVIYGVLGGRFGLGTTNWNELSVNPWNILGKDFVRVAVEGDCVIDVNSNLIIADNQALVAVDSFGKDAVQRVTFTSVDAREIRIPSGVELDLSSFGHGEKRQEIAFGGRVKLVLEPGASIRGPRSPKGGVILYFNDEAELTFESPSDRAAGNIGYKGADNVERCKVLGNIQIWLNKSAKMTVGDGTLVGVQSDDSTPKTDVTISLNRQSRFEIGNVNQAGGAFEVGNPASVTGGSVKFALAARHVDSVFHLDRQGFFGLGAGILEKQGAMNGTATAANNPELDGGKAKLNNGVPAFNASSAAWKVAPRFNVDKVSIAFTAGRFEHNNIADGADSSAALLAVGPAAAYDLKMSAPGQVVIKGGGNMMLVPAAAKDGVLVNVWDFAGAFPDGVQYGIMGSAPMLAQREDVADRVPFNNSGFEYNFAAGKDYFALLAAQNYADQKTAFATVGAVATAPMRAAFVNLDAENSKYPADAAIIVRNDVNAIQGGSLADALAVGVAAGIETDALGPTSYGVPAR